MIDVIEKKSKWGKVWKVAIVLFTVLLSVAGIAYSLTDVGEAASSYEKNRDRAKSLGLVFDQQSAELLYHVAPVENAFPEIEEPLKAMRTLDDTFSEPGEKSIKHTDAEFLQQWASHSKEIKATERLSLRKHYLRNHAVRGPMFDGSPEYGWTKSLVRVLVRRCKIAGTKNDLTTVARLLPCAAKIAVMLDDDPNVMASLVRASCDVIITAELRNMVTFHGREPSWQTAISKVLTILDKPYDLRPMIKRQHWTSYHAAQVFLGAEKDSDSFFQENRVQFLMLRMVPRFRYATLSRIHEYYNRQLERYPTDIRDYAMIEKDAANAGQFINQETFSFSLAGLVSPTYVDVPKGIHRNVVSRYAVSEALEILRRKQDPNDGLPLKGRFANDLDGKPLRIKHLAKGWIVYSVWKNGTDDGGVVTKGLQNDYVVDLSPATMPMTRVRVTAKP